jgi:hypothetical protein
MAALLNYDITANEFPLQASPATGSPNVVTLTLVVSNPNPTEPVALQGLIITIPVGADGSQLTADGAGIGPVAAAGWTLHGKDNSPGFVRYIFYPEKGEDEVKGGGLSFVFNNIQVNSQTGTVSIEIMEGSNRCQPPACPTEVIRITKFPAGWGEVSVWVDPPDVALGGTTTLHWSGPEGATYSVEYYDAQAGRVVNLPGPGDPALSNAGQYRASGDPPLVLVQTTTFTLNVELTEGKDHYYAQQQKTVTVELPRELKIDSFEGSANAFGARDVVTLSWQVQVADGCSLEVDHGSGSVAVGAVDDIEGAWNSCQVTSTDGLTLLVSKADGSGAQLGSITLPTPVPDSITFRLSASKGNKVIQQTFSTHLLPAQIDSFSGDIYQQPGPVYDPAAPGWKRAVKWQVRFASNIYITREPPPSPFTPPTNPSPLSGQAWLGTVEETWGTYTMQAHGFGAPATASFYVGSTVPWYNG